jgi:hypothetical protein
MAVHFKLSRIVTRIDNSGRGMPFRDTDLRQFEMHPFKASATFQKDSRTIYKSSATSSSNEVAREIILD